MAPAHIIDVDEEILIDLTADPPMIDLTSDAEDDPNDAMKPSPFAEVKRTSMWAPLTTGKGCLCLTTL